MLLLLLMMMMNACYERDRILWLDLEFLLPEDGNAEAMGMALG